jgi:hypothetical protein
LGTGQSGSREHSVTGHVDADESTDITYLTAADGYESLALVETCRTFGSTGLDFLRADAAE